jgi:transglutaminase-like putative cysteine protease
MGRRRVGAGGSGAVKRTERYLPLAEVGLLALAVGTAAGCNRLFVGWSFLGSLLVPLVACWMVSVVTRRLGAPVWAAGLVQVVAAAVVLTWRYAPGTSWLGLPGPTTLGLLREDVRTSFADFSDLVAPVPVTDGFLVVLAAAMWVFGFFADTAAFRYRAPVQAAVPYGATFVAVGILARDEGRTGAVVWFLAGLAAYAVTQRGLEASRRRWITGEDRRGAGAVLLGAAASAIVAVVIGLVVGPSLPGSDEAVVDLRSIGRSGGPRTVVSPFVGVTSLLGERSDQVVFTVEADAPAYWRLTSLERYDADRGIWVSRGSYREAPPRLEPSTPRAVPAEPLVQQFRIQGLGGLWLPAAYEPARVEGGPALSWDPSTSSLITRDESLTSGDAYTVVSSLPDLSAAVLDGLPASGAGVDPVYLEDPDLDPAVRATASRVTEAATTPYERALALQGWFREGFVYDEDVDYRASPDPTLAFLSERRGFCQQFSSAFALMARALGLPARVAVGFTPGDGVVLDSEGTPAEGFVVRGRHAHAWPEVHIDGAGWVAFEPTPGRGNPRAEQYTGVAPQQAEPPPPQAATTTTAAPTPRDTLPLSPGPEIDPGQLETVTPPAEGPAAAPVAGLRVLGVLLGFTVLAVTLLALRAWARHLTGRRQLAADPIGGRVALAWTASLSWLALVGLRPETGETPRELMVRASETLGDTGPGRSVLDDLAAAETARRFGSAPPSEDTVRRAELAAAEVADAVRARSSRASQFRRLVG